MASIRKLTNKHIKLIEPSLPKVRGVKRAHLKKTLNGILHVPQNGCRWADMPSLCGNHKTACNMFRRYSLNGVWDRILAVLVSQKAETGVGMVDSTFVNARRTSASIAAEAGSERAIGRSKGGLTTKMHTFGDAKGRPVGFRLTGGNASD